MQFTKEQFGMLNVALQTKPNAQAQGGQEARAFPLAEQKTAMEAYEKLLKHVEENSFIDGEEEFDTKEKALLLSVLDRDWGVQNLKVILSLRELLA